MKVANWLAAVMASFGLICGSGAAEAGQLTLYSTIGMRSVVDELVPQFEKASGHKVNVTFGLGGALAKRVQDGETPDVLISTRAGIDGLVAGRKITSGNDATLARSGIGIAVRKGTQRPDISTPDALKATLLAAKSISYSNPAAGGASGVHFGKVVERLGLTAALKDKTKHPAAGGSTGAMLASGDVELAVQQIAELLEVDGIVVVGPLPGDLQSITVFAAGIPTAAKEAAAAKDFIRFLQTPDAVKVIKAKGLDPA